MKEGQGGFADRFAKSIESRVEIDKYRNTCDNAVDLVKNSVVFFGGDSEEKRLELSDRVFGRFGKSDKSFQDILDRSQNPAVNKSVAMADKESLVNSVFIAMNLSVLGGDLVTDSMTADDIDAYLPKNFKGIGREIKAISLTKDEEKRLIGVNSMIETSDLFNPTMENRRKVEGSKKIKDAFVSVSTGSLLRQYADVSRLIINADETSDRTKIPFRPAYNEDGERAGGVEAAWQVTPEKLAESMLFMDSSVRWQSYTPPEWFKQLDGETQARIEYMIMVCDGAANLSYAGKDLDKILGNKMYFLFDNEKFTKLFNGDFKLVMSKMLNDLCETYTDVNGMTSLRYKEDIKDGRRVIKESVKNKIEGIREYKNDLAKFLAEQNGRETPNYIDQMNAYSAWNLFFMFGDSSICDRMRLLPTYGGVICDALRTLNPESKAHIKLKISKGEQEVGDDQLFEAEYFAGNIGSHVEDMLKMERDLGVKISGEKSLRRKVIDGDLPLFRYKMCYGLLDFVGGGRDLYKNTGVKDEKGNVVWRDIDKSENKTLAGLLMNHASFDIDGNLIKVNETDDAWSFGTKQVDFLNWFRDQQEAAALSFNCLTGKAEVKDLSQFARVLKDKIGMVRGLGINGKRLGYSTQPDYWANIIWGSLPIDKDRISTDYIRLRVSDSQGNESQLAYSMYINGLLKGSLGLSDSEIDIYRVMNLLGVDIKRGENPVSFKVSSRNEGLRQQDLARTKKLRRMLMDFYKK